jgi:hypothetical protein
MVNVRDQPIDFMVSKNLSTVDSFCQPLRKAAISPAMSAGSGAENSSLSPVTGWSNPSVAA